MITFNLELNVRPNKHGLYIIYIRITENRVKKKINTEIAIPKEHFNNKAKWGKWVRNTNPKHAKYADIEHKIEELKSTAKLISESGESVIARINKKNTDDNTSQLTIKAYFESFLKDMESENSYIHWKGTKSKLLRFKEFVGGEVRLKDVDTFHVQRFKIFLLDKGLNNVSINNNMARIHHAFKVALRNGIIDIDPFRALKTLRELPSKKQRLTDEQIEKLENLELRTDRKINWPFKQKYVLVLLLQCRNQD
ncbi:tyrosine-type recombinase/integrase [Dyadobacter koreensis]|uniref:tyrosine-type recombinase/integrase n=1 Tax=Dyadobacter koreensis TaxID=408657 RepID=UPI000B884522|nr:phage integrase SAM-like domain-containing protein [Dyadobacter koreensis]